jgi:hypothetical protein
VLLHAVDDRAPACRVLRCGVAGGWVTTG